MRNSEGFLKVKGFSLPANEKSRDIVTKSRIGQGPYRTNLLSKWSGRSSLSNYSNENFLIASHIKPWKDCDNDEAVDPDNGLLLIPSHDAAFDKGHISFDNDGLIIISSKLDSNDLEVLGLSNKLKIRKVTSRLQKYLEYHRKNIFNG